MIATLQSLFGKFFDAINAANDPKTDPEVLKIKDEISCILQESKQD